MNIIRQIASIFLVALVILSGCTTTDGQRRIDENVVISNHVAMYASSTNSQNDDIAAILREFSSFTVTNRFASWQDLMNKENLFMAKLQTNYISMVYTVIPSSEEIKISDSFLDTIIVFDMYYHPEWIYQIGQRIPYVTGKFISQMNDYEYDKRTDK